MKHRIVSVTEFKAKCLALFDDVGERGGTITVTKRGRPLARVGPAKSLPWKSPAGAWAGKVTLVRGILDADTSQLWESIREPKGART